MGYKKEHNAEIVQRPVKGRSLWADGIRRLRKRTFAMVCLGVVLVYFVLAGMIFLNDVLGLDLKVFQWNQIIGPSYQAPLDSYVWTPEGQAEVETGKALFGTDFLGQSTLRKTVYGAKTSITVALCASFISLLIGVPLGAVAGYFRGWVDDVIVWFYTTLGTIPYILLVMAFAVVLRDRNIFGWEIRGITAVYLAIGLTSWVGICRLIRGEIIKRKESEYVLAARALGCSNSRIIFRHLLPNVFHVIIINFSLRFVSFIHAEVILSFLGLGETDKPSWGGMIDAARTELARNVWWEMAAATVAIFFISLALNIFGDALRDCLDPKLRTD
ncbi:MAG: ABC transporter permease [Anaerohalosphaeraceae bacterium]|jgi:peptide/nickel transport system permease protein